MMVFKTNVLFVRRMYCFLYLITLYHELYNQKCISNSNYLTNINYLRVEILGFISTYTSTNII